MRQVCTAARHSQTRWALAGLSLTMLMPSLATSTANVALPDLARTLGTSFRAAQWIVLAYLLTVTALVVVVGRLGDVVGRRRLLLTGTTVFAAGSLLCGIAPSLELLIAARVIQGAGAAVMMALTMAFAGAVIPRERIGRGMGLLGAMSAIGTTLGPAIGGLLIASAGSLAIFVVNLPLAAVTMPILVRALPQDPLRGVSDLSRLDLPGMALLIVSLAGYALAFTMERGHFGFANAAILAAAMCTSVWFAAIEMRTPHPLIRLDMLRNRALIAGLSTSTIVSSVMMCTLVVGPFYVAKVAGLGPARAGFALAVGPLVAALAGVPAGRLVDGFGTYRMTLTGLVAMGSGAVVLSMVPPAFGIVGYLVPIVVMTAGYGVFQAANNTAVVTGTDASERGVVSGMLNLSRNLGLVAGASALGAVFAWGIGSEDIGSAGPIGVAAGAHASFATAAMLIGISLVIALRLTRGASHLRALESAS